MEFNPFSLLSLYASCGFSIIYAYYYQEDICKFGIKLYENYIQNYLISSSIRTISAYSSYKNYISNLKKNIYTYNPHITYTIDFVSYTIHMLHARIYNYNIEPFQTIWINQCFLLKNDMIWDDEFKIDYIYYFIDNKADNNIFNFFKTFNTMSYYISNSLPQNIHKEVLLYGKYNDIYVSRSNQLCNTFALDINNFTKPSRVSFLSVNLIIPQQKTIDIIIDKNLLYVNNEILSRAFIKRYLDHNNIRVELNDNYTVDFIDNNIDMKTLKSNEYIILQLNDYNIHKTNCR